MRAHSTKHGNAKALVDKKEQERKKNQTAGGRNTPALCASEKKAG